jgi:hypothetical protein
MRRRATVSRLRTVQAAEPGAIQSRDDEIIKTYKRV